MALTAALTANRGAFLRQCAVIHTQGRVAVHTADRTLPWSGALIGDGWTTQGNRSVGERTLEAIAKAFDAARDRDLVDRVLRSLEAGEATGADREGGVSAMPTSVDREEDPLWDLRVDHHEQPAEELRRLHVARAARY